LLPAQLVPESLANVPGPAARRLALHVTPAAERALRRGHPWLYEGSILQISSQGRPGDLAVVFDRRRRFLAVGLYDPLSPIRVRILQHGRPAPIDGEWFHTRLEAAIQRRAPLLAQPPEAATTGYRLVHGENDGLPGLVLDRYAGTVVCKLYTAAWIPHLGAVVAALTVVNPTERLVLRLSRALGEQPEHLHGLRDGMVLAGPALDGPVRFQENGLRFEVDPVQGHKTGFYLDQRDNRARVEQLAGGRSVLNVFAYTGAFAVYAARGGARRIVSVDVSAPALQAAARNLAHNGHLPAVAAVAHEVVLADAFEALAQLAAASRRFDLVLLDPPSFAQNRAQVGPALAAYERLTELGLVVLQPGGILVQASCSRQVEAEAFFATVHRAAKRAGRPLHELERTGHPVDHPITFPEGAYLKCLFAQAP